MQLDELTPLLKKQETGQQPKMELVKQSSVKRIHKAATTMKILDSIHSSPVRIRDGMGAAYIGEYAKTFNASDKGKSVMSKSKMLGIY